MTSFCRVHKKIHTYHGSQRVIVVSHTKYGGLQCRIESHHVQRDTGQDHWTVPNFASRNHQIQK